jgi:hypothetical protein
MNPSKIRQNPISAKAIHATALSGRPTAAMTVAITTIFRLALSIVITPKSMGGINVGKCDGLQSKTYFNVIAQP